MEAVDEAVHAEAKLLGAAKHRVRGLVRALQRAVRFAWARLAAARRQLALLEVGERRVGGRQRRRQVDEDEAERLVAGHLEHVRRVAGQAVVLRSVGPSGDGDSSVSAKAGGGEGVVQRSI
eukprot:357965-Chlamydomonas_euryale.AAC.2